jgi:hypothetical protein
VSAAEACNADPVQSVARNLPYAGALVIGVVAGVLARSPIVAGLAALICASIWGATDRGSNGSR